MRRKKPPEIIAPILAEVKSALREIYGDNLRKVILYGSYARGDYDTEGSDIDVMLVLNEMGIMSTEQKKYMDEICDIDLKYDTIVSIIPIKERDYYERNTPLLYNIKKEGFLI